MIQLVIVGGGPAGIAAALEASRIGVKVTMVAAEKAGGRACWHSLLPSKVFLHSAEAFEASQKFPELGLTLPATSPDLQQVKKRIQEVSSSWHEQIAGRLEDRGVKIIPGRAALQGKHRLEVQVEGGKDKTIGYDKLILATGSVPIFLPQLKPDGQAILAPRLAPKLSRWPEHIVVIGAGATGSEYAYLFARMGSQVTWITDLPEILPRFDPDIKAWLESSLQALGVTLMKSTAVTGVLPDMGGVVVTLRGGRALAASHAFIAIGRKADVEGLNLESAGVRYDKSGIQVDEFAQTTNPDIYAAGDVAGFPYTVNKGQVQGYVAVRHLAGQPVRPIQLDLLPEAVYTRPMLAQVGLNQKTAEALGRPIKSVTINNKNRLSAHITGSQAGALKLLYDPENRKIVGGAATGEGAADKMAVLAGALQGGLDVEQLADLFFAHPTEAELLSEVAREI